jgi:hypothetical protein
MSSLLSLEPRDAGTEELEPRAQFSAGRNDLHQRAGRVPTHVCGDFTYYCIP